MSIEQIQDTINGYYDKMVEAMNNDNGYIEQECSDMIDYWKDKKESAEIDLENER